MDRTDKKARTSDAADPFAVSAREALRRATGGLAPAASIQYSHTRTLPVPRDTLRSNRLIAGCEPGPFIDAYKVLRTRVLQAMRERNWNTLAITSPNAGAGKSLTAINLAISMAMESQQTVLLVDADLRDPGLHRYFGFEPEYGLGDYLLDQRPVPDLLINPQGIDRLVLLPCVRPLPHSSELLSTPRMADLVSELKSRYESRMVVFDLPHLATSDTLVFAPYVEAILLVIEEGRTTRDELEHALGQFQTTPLIGTVLNKAMVETAKSR